MSLSIGHYLGTRIYLPDPGVVRAIETEVRRQHNDEAATRLVREIKDRYREVCGEQGYLMINFSSGSSFAPCHSSRSLRSIPERTIENKFPRNILVDHNGARLLPGETQPLGENNTGVIKIGGVLVLGYGTYRSSQARR